jgi:hypothetical protein
MTENNKIRCELEVKESKSLQKAVASELKQEDKPLEDILKYERKTIDRRATSNN